MARHQRPDRTCRRRGGRPAHRRGGQGRAVPARAHGQPSKVRRQRPAARTDRGRLRPDHRHACRADGLMTAVRLTEGWQLKLTEAGDWIPAIVPGTAAQALQAAGRWSIEQPTPLHDKDIWYRTRFAGTGPRTLRFEGLATIAEVQLNGAQILASDNMFLAHEVDVNLAGDNELLIVFHALDKELASRKGSRARWRTKIVENNALRLVRTTLLGHMTGWQPPVHAVGPWRTVELIDKKRAIEMRATLDGDDGVLTVG